MFLNTIFSLTEISVLPFRKLPQPNTRIEISQSRDLASLQYTAGKYRLQNETNFYPVPMLPHSTRFSTKWHRCMFDCVCSLLFHTQYPSPSGIVQNFHWHLPRHRTGPIRKPNLRCCIIMYLIRINIHWPRSQEPTTPLSAIVEYNAFSRVPLHFSVFVMSQKKKN